MITMKEDIKTNEDLYIYGWEMKIIQIEEDINVLQKRLKEIMPIYLGLLKKKKKKETN